jgi:hypothetical protein
MAISTPDRAFCAKRHRRKRARRRTHFKEYIIQTFHNGMKQGPETTYGTSTRTFLPIKTRISNFRGVIRASRRPS